LFFIKTSDSNFFQKTDSPHFPELVRTRQNNWFYLI